MRWSRRGINDVSARQARRPVTFNLAVAGAMILAATGIGCGHSTSTSGIAGPVTVSAAKAPPYVTAISPASGARAGGTSVTITGRGFTGATRVDFGGASAAMTVNSDTEITATSPPGTGTVNVTVTAPSGNSAISPADQFTYGS